MSNYVYDNTALFFPKTDLDPIPGGADPTKYVQAVDWNTLNQAVDDIKGVLRSAVWLGLNDQVSDPVPSGISTYLWLSTTNVLNLKNGGTNYPIVLGTRAVSAGTGLTGGGDLSADRTISLANTTVTPGSYTAADITVDAQGRITAASNGTGTVSSSRLINTGTGLQGGGDLTADRTISLADTAVSPGSYTLANITVDAQGRLTAATTGGIGSVLASATVGSILFVDTGSTLGEDNTKLFWDSTNKRLGLGTVSPGTVLEIAGAGNTAALTLGSGSATAVSAASTARIIYNQSTDKLQASLNGAAYADIGAGIGNTVTSGTQGSILFIGASSVLAQDNANLFWDDTNNRLTVGAAGITKAGFTHEFSKDATLTVTASAYGTGLNSEFMTFRGRGTAASTTVVQSGDVLGAFSFTGAKSSTAIYTGAFLRGVTTELWSGTAGGTKIQFFTTPNTTQTQTLRMTLDQDGSFTVEGGGIWSRAASDSAGFYTTAYYAGTTYGVPTQADRDLKIQSGSNAGGQRNQYLMYNGRFTGNIDSPTLTQGLYDRVCGIEFNSAADSLGPNPNSSINFIVNTGTKSTGSEITVTPTRAMTITYTARVGIGQVDPTHPLDVETIVGNTNAKFGATNPVYVVSNGPNVGFNAYYNSGYKFGKGSSTQRGGVISFDCSSGDWSLNTSNAAGNANAAITLITPLAVTAAGLLDMGLSGGTTSALIARGGSTAAVSAASTGRLRFNESTNRFQVSLNTAAYGDLVTQVAGAGTANTLAKYTAAGVIADSSITDNGTTVTIGGTTTINTPAGGFLNVAGAASSYAILSATSNGGVGNGFGAYVQLTNTDGIISMLRVADSGSGTSYQTEASMLTLSTGSGYGIKLNTNATDNSGLRISSGAPGGVTVYGTLGVGGAATLGDNTSDSHIVNGKLRINTATGGQLLEVKGVADGQTDGAIQIKSNKNTWGDITGQLTTTAAGSTTTDNFRISVDSGFLAFRTNSTDRMTVSHTGTVRAASDALIVLDVEKTGTGLTNIASSVGQFVTSATFDTTAGAIPSIGIFANAGSTRSAGSNDLINYGMYASATNGQINYALFTDLGDVLLNSGGGMTTVNGDFKHSGTNLGFYGTTPIALQTGVTVDAAGIHAALVNLGLITA